MYCSPHSHPPLIFPFLLDQSALSLSLQKKTFPQLLALLLSFTVKFVKKRSLHIFLLSLISFLPQITLGGFLTLNLLSWHCLYGGHQWPHVAKSIGHN